MSFIFGSYWLYVVGRNVETKCKMFFPKFLLGSGLALFFQGVDLFSWVTSIFHLVLALFWSLVICKVDIVPPLGLVSYLHLKLFGYYYVNGLSTLSTLY